MRGVSTASHQKEVLYFKHIGLIEESVFSEKYHQFFEEAKSQKLLTREEKEKYLKRDGLYNPKIDAEIREQTGYLDRLETTRSKFFKKSDIEEIDKQIKEVRPKLENLLKQRAELFVNTAEEHAFKKINQYSAVSCAYKDSSCSIPFLSEEAYEDAELSDIVYLIELYQKHLSSFNQTEIKFVAITPFFMNMFSLCGDDIFKFYGKPVVELTFWQQELYRYGGYFKHILSELGHKIPDEIAADPDKLIKYFESNKNARHELDRVKNKENVAATALVGATKEDLESAGISTANSIDWSKEAKKHGGSLNMEQIIRLSGD